MTAQLRKPRWKLALRGYLYLVGALIIGTLVSFPVLFSSVRYYEERTYLFDEQPEDDSELMRWAASRPGFDSFDLSRRGEELHIRMVYHGFKPPPSVSDIPGQMRHLGYRIKELRGGSMGMLGNPFNIVTDALTDPLTLAVMLAGMQLALGFIGIRQIRAANRSGLQHPPGVRADRRRAISLGVVGGVTMIGLGIAYAMGLETLLGHSAPSPWDEIQKLSGEAKVVLLLFGAVGAPVAEELFFRGFLFSLFQREGYPWSGMLFSSALFAAIHFSDPYNIPGILLFGFVLAWLYRQTGSLVAPITAHAVNNGSALAFMMFS